MIAYRKKIFTKTEFYYRIRTLNNKGLRQVEKWDITEIRISTHECPRLIRRYEPSEVHEDLLECLTATAIEWEDAKQRLLKLIDSKEPIDFLDLPF